MEIDKNKYILDVAEVAELLNVKEATVRDWARKKRLKARKIGKKWFFNKSTILGKKNGGDNNE